MRRIFIGDIQGCYDQLDALLGEVEFSSGDRLYCVGDLVNRGPSSLAVLRRLRALEARVVLGNHDVHFLRLAASSTAPEDRASLRDVLEAADGDALIAWLRAQPVMRVEDDVVLVHAGLHPRWTDVQSSAVALNAALASHLRTGQEPSIQLATTVRYCDPEGRRPPYDHPPPGPPFRPWDDFYRGARTVVFGHWARRGLVWRPRVRGLDTACVYGGALTAWIAEEDRIVQVPGWRVSKGP